MFNSGYVSIVGKPNAGKSTLLNALVGEKVAIVSNKPQTTRNNILGIKTTNDYQIVFIDTPGIHPTKNHLDKFMMKSVRSALAGVDLIVYLVDCTVEMEESEKQYIEKLKQGETPLLVALTKIDKKCKVDFDADVNISSLNNENLNELLNLILQKLPEYEQKNLIFDEDYYTDKSISFLVKENIREQVLKNINKEIPHGVAIEVIKFEETDNLVKIECDIVCERQTHKGIIIGKQGTMLKKIGELARKECEVLLGKKVFLKLFVKVESDWRNKPSQITSLGYKD